MEVTTIQGRAMVYEVIEQHAEMAAFLWELRGMALDSHHYTLADVIDLEERIEAHLDGLRIAGETGWEATVAGLGRKEPGFFFAAAVLAIDARDASGFAAVLDATEGAPGLAAGVEGALAWVPSADAFALIEPLLVSRHSPDHPRLGHLALTTCVAHRRDPRALLGDALFSRDPALQARAFRAVGELGRADLGEELRQAWGSESAPLRFWSAWGGALLGIAGAAEVLWDIARESGEFSELAAGVAARASAPGEARVRIETLTKWPGLERECLFAAGALGDPVFLPWLLDQTEVAPLSRLAGEAFAQITGATIDGPLRGLPASGFEDGPNDDPGDSRVVMNPDTQLAWPHAANARSFHVAHRGRFAPGVRHVDGRPLDDQALDRVLRHGTQRRRAGAAIESAVRAARAAPRPLFDVTARAFRQRDALGSAEESP